MNLTSIIRILVLYYCIFLQLYSLYRIFGSLVGRTSKTLKSQSESGEQFAREIYSDLVENISLGNISEIEYPDRFYMILIDALRPDFINERDTPFIWSLVNPANDIAAKAFTVKVNSPTVTLPRIKSILTGSIPSYQDFITNFHSTRLEEDNLVWKFKQSGKNICFYGDDTWLKLFNKEKYFTRSEGVHSFFVNDWIEVDENVTRNLDNELDHKLKPECQITILHYLGLDHIGHVHGPKSSLINEKLGEMDRIVQRVYMSAEKNSLLFICGDHGMANIGGHGGDSWEETHTVLIALAKEAKLKYFGYNSTSNSEQSGQALVYQTDLAPTIAVLFGLDIPKPSIGTLIPEILAFYLNPEHLFQSYHKNFLHLIGIMDQAGHSQRVTAYLSELTDAIHSNEKKFLNNLLPKYIKLNQELSDILGEELAGERDLYQLILSILILAQVVVIMTIICTGGEGESSWSTILLLSPVSKNSFGAIIATFLCFIFTSLDFTLLIFNFFILYHLKNSDWHIFKSKLEFLPALAIYFASSLIEEEHYVRYFLWSSLIFYKFIITSPRLKQEQSTSLQFASVIMLLFIHRLTSILNQTGQKWIEVKDVNDVILDYKCVEFVSCVSVILLLVLTPRSSTLFKCTMCYIYILKLFLYWNENTSSILITSVQLGYVFVGVTVVWEYFVTRNNFLPFNFCLLFSILLHKLVNYPVISSVVLQLRLLHYILDHCIIRTAISGSGKSNVMPNYVTFIYTWFSYACFFYQGNSNNITTIEVNIGYIGLESYNSLIIGSLIFFYTSSCPFLVYSYIFSDNLFEPFHKSQITNALVKVNAIECFIYSIVIFMFRNHLFIWSVFVPKLLYLAWWTAFHIIIVSLTLVVN